MRASYVMLVGVASIQAACTDIDQDIEGTRQRAITGPSELRPVPVPSPEHPAYDSGFIDQVAVLYKNSAEHAENVELRVLPSGEMLLAFRGGATGQPETGAARIRIFDFDPDTYRGRLRSEVQVPPGDPSEPPRGIRDPKLFLWDGVLALGAISREAGFPIRDLMANARTILAESTDDGFSFTTPEPMRFSNTGDETWGLWRYSIREFQDPLGIRRRVLHATGYNDGDRQAAYFVSFDGGASFTRLGDIVSDPAEVPSEAELFFLGPNQSTAVSLVRLDNQGLFSDGQTAICTKRAGWPGFFWGDFACTRRVEQRLDGPSQIIEDEGRYFVAARKHLSCTRKRTALYEIRGDLLDPEEPVSLCEIAELPSNGDTAYVAVAPIPDQPRQYVAAWYSTPLGLDLPWLPAQLAPSWILAARLDFSKYDPDICTPPPPDPECPPVPLPVASGREVEGRFLISLSPSFFPDRAAYFSAMAFTDGGNIAIVMQPLDQQALLEHGEHLPVGDAFRGAGELAADGTFTIEFDSPRVPREVYPLGGGNTAGMIHYVLEGFRLHGAITSADGFCGGASGNVVIASDIRGLIPPSTYYRLDGSSFGATRDVPSTGCE